MQVYIQDAMTYIRALGRPDLFITFTCNQNWEEIKILLLLGQTSMHRHDITARVFTQKLKSLMNLIIQHLVFWYVVGFTLLSGKYEVYLMRIF